MTKLASCKNLSHNSASFRQVYLSIVIAAGILLGSQLAAQTVNLGDDVARPIPGAGHDYVKGLSDTVSPSNGSLHIKIDLPVPAGRGFTLPFAITYDSGELYHFTSPVSGSGGFGGTMATDRSQAGGGWSNTLPYTSAQGFAVGVPMAPAYSDTAWMCPMSSSYNFYDSSGGSHMLGLSAIGIGVMTSQAPIPQQACAGLTYGNIGYSYYTLGGDDQVYGQMDEPCNGAYQGLSYPNDCDSGAPAFTVTDLSGNLYSFPANSVTNNVWTPNSPAQPSFIFPAKIEDRNGNIINFTPNGNGYGLPITDTAGRTMVSSDCETAYCAGPSTYTVGGLTYLLTYSNVGSANFSIGTQQIYPIIDPLPSNVSCEVSNTVSYSEASRLTSITLPNGQSYLFQYDPTYGLLSKITYPDGGWVQYTWGLSTGYTTMASFNAGQSNGYTTIDGLSGGCGYLYKTPVVTQREVGYSSNSTPAQTQTFGYNTNWVTNGPYGYTGYWTTKTATVTTTDNVTGELLKTNSTYGDILQPYQPNSSGTIPPQIPVESAVQYEDGNNNVLETVIKTWADQFEMTSETTTLSPLASYGVAYCYNLGNCALSNNFPGVVAATFEYGIGQVPSSMPPPASSPGTATRSTTYGYYGIALPCQFLTAGTCPLTFNPPAAADLPSSRLVPVPNQIVTYSGSATFNSNTGSWSGTRIAETDAYYDGETSFTGTPAATGHAVSSLPTGAHDETNYGAGVATPRGNPTTVIKWSNIGTSPTTTYTYDETGQILSRTDPCGNSACSDITGSQHSTTYAYTDSPSGGNSAGNSNAYLTQITHPTTSTGVTLQENFTYNYPTGTLASAIDENGQPTTYTYADSLNRLTKKSFADGGGTSITYNDGSYSPGGTLPNIVTTESLNTSGATEVSTAFMDGVGHVIHSQLTDPDGNDTVDTTYDGEGHVATKSNPHRAVSAPTDGTTTYYYDALGRQLEVSHPDGTTQQWCYNDIVPATTLTIYCSGHLGSITGSWVDSTDELSNHSQRTSDAFGRLVEVMEPTSTSQTASMETDYGYDALNNLVAVTQWGGTHGSSGSIGRSFTYDSLSRLQSALNVETGTVNYVYDLNGNLQTRTDHRSVATSYTYDVMDRLLGKAYNDGATLPVTFTYDTSAVSNSANTKGRLTSASVMNGTTRVAQRLPYSYDVMGRLQNEQQCTPANCSGAYYTPAYTYDLAGGATSSTSGLPNTVTGGLGGSITVANVTQNTIQLSVGYDTAHRLSYVTSNVANSASYPATLFQVASNSAPAYGPMGLMNAYYGINTATNAPELFLARSYDQRGRVLSETNSTTESGSVGSISISGTEQSGAPGTGTITINRMPPGPGSGQVIVTIDGNDSITDYWSQSPSGMLPSTLASNIASQINSGSAGTLVTANASGSNIYLTAKQPGLASNYSIAVRQQGDTNGQVSISAPSSLTGGSSGSGPIYDSGTISATINGNVATATWGQGSTATSVANALESSINSVDGSFIHATASNGVVSLTSVGTGEATDWPITVSATPANNNFGGTPSFNPTANGMAYTDTGTAVKYGYTIASSGGYDGAGNIKNVADTVTGTWTYTYDPLNRLKTSQNTAASTTFTQYANYYGCWSYDGFGNRTAENYQTSACPSQETSVTPTATYNGLNRVTWTLVNGAVNGFVYDSAGNVSNDNANAYLYDGEGRLCAVKNLTVGTMTGYVYDADGTRVAKGTLSIWPTNSLCPAPSAIALTASYVLGPGGEQVSEVNGSGAWQHTNLFAAGKLLATYSSTSNEALFALNDWLGTKRMEYGATGCGTSYFNLPYGNPEIQMLSGNCATDATEHHYTGKERDTESGNDYFGARYYASSMGRWLSPDWAAKATPVPYAKLSDPQTLNLYAYVGNNPLTRFDADGHTITCTGDQCKQYIAALQKATGMTFAADKNGLLSITSRPDKMGYVGSAVAGVIGDKKNAVNISADSHNDVLGGHYAGHGNQILNFNSINALSSAKGGFTPQSIVTHETMEAYVGLKLGGAYDMATYSKAHAAAIGYENAERLSEGLPARIDEYGSGSNGTFHGTVNFSFWKEHFDVTNGTSVSNVTSERTNQPGQTIQ